MLDVLLGGLTGLIGNVITGITKYKTQKLQFEHEQKMLELETKSMIMESKMQMAITKTQVEGEVEIADANAYVESIKASQKPLFSEKWIDKLFNVKGKTGRFFAIPAGILIALAFGFVDWLRGVMRPFLTIYLVGMSTAITIMAWKILHMTDLTTFSLSDAIGVYKQVTSIIIYLTVSCVTWWFGDRSLNKILTRNIFNKSSNNNDIMDGSL